MSIRRRVAFLDVGERPSKLSLARYDRLNDGKDAEPSFAGRRVRFAMLLVAVVDRKVVRVVGEEYWIDTFRPDGLIDRGEKHRMMLALVNAVEESCFAGGAFGVTEQGGNTVQAANRFTLAGFRWSPDRELRAAILEASGVSKHL